MPKHGKKFQKAFEAIDGLKMYDVAEAVELVLKSSFAKFDETVDVAVNLGVNPKYSSSFKTFSLVAVRFPFSILLRMA